MFRASKRRMARGIRSISSMGPGSQTFLRVGLRSHLEVHFEFELGVGDRTARTPTQLLGPCGSGVAKSPFCLADGITRASFRAQSPGRRLS